MPTFPACGPHCRVEPASIRLRSKMNEWLDATNGWIIYLIAVILIGCGEEISAALAGRERDRPASDGDGFLSALAAPSIDLFALMVVFLALEGIAVVAFGFAGYGLRSARVRSRRAMWIMAVMIGGGVLLVLDLDRAQSGFITIRRQPVTRSSARRNRSRYGLDRYCGIRSRYGLSVRDCAVGVLPVLHLCTSQPAC